MQLKHCNFVGKIFRIQKTDYKNIFSFSELQQLEVGIRDEPYIPIVILSLLTGLYKCLKSIWSQGAVAFIHQSVCILVHGQELVSRKKVIDSSCKRR